MMRYLPVLTCTVGLFVTSITYAQNGDRRDQTIVDAFSTCLKGAVQAERKKQHRTVKEIKLVCAQEIAAFHASLPDFAKNTVTELLDEKLAEELR